MHKYAINTLVELENGARLFIFSLGRDCDGTPLYNLAWEPVVWDNYSSFEELKRCFRHDLICGFDEKSLTLIHGKYVDQDKPDWFNKTNLF